MIVKGSIKFAVVRSANRKVQTARENSSSINQKWKNMNQYKLELEVLHGKFEGKTLELLFEADNDNKAREFAKASAELKAYNQHPIQFGGYRICKKSSLVWLTIPNSVN